MPSGFELKLHTPIPSRNLETDKGLYLAPTGAVILRYSRHRGMCLKSDENYTLGVVEIHHETSWKRLPEGTKLTIIQK